MNIANQNTTEIVIDRTNQKKLRFRGNELASVRNRWLNGREQTRWTEYTVYRTSGGNYVLHVEFVTMWQGEANESSAQIFKTPAELVAYLVSGDLDELQKELLVDLGPCFEQFLIEEVE